MVNIVISHFSEGFLFVDVIYMVNCFNSRLLLRHRQNDTLLDDIKQLESDVEAYAEKESQVS